MPNNNLEKNPLILSVSLILGGLAALGYAIFVSVVAGDYLSKVNYSYNWDHQGGDAYRAIQF